jgi:alkylation response protein AidB-like acyl-CoA dehydrogenase
VETVLKGFQITRTLCAGLSLGAGDRALPFAVEFARRHHLYGRPQGELSQAGRALAEAYADQLLAEVVTSVSVRGLPGEASVSSAVVKYLVPTRTDALLDRLGNLLGARVFLRGVYHRGAFEEMRRDHRIVGLFDGSTVVNLTVLIGHFLLFARAYGSGSADLDAVRRTAGLRYRSRNSSPRGSTS